MISEENDLINIEEVIEEIDLFIKRNLIHLNREYYKGLVNLLDDCKDLGGDIQFEGDWYPHTLIRSSYFETYAQELAEDSGLIPENACWPNNCIDWEKATHQLRQDYKAIDFNGVCYFAR